MSSTFETRFGAVQACSSSRFKRASGAAFAAANADLFDHPAALKPYYRHETLRSDLARAVFVLPDRLAPADGTQRAA